MPRADLDVLTELVAIGGRDVVDVGCGDGSLVRALAARGASALGVEVSADAVARASARGGRCVLGSADALPLPDESADACLMMRSLHHVPPPRMARALAELRRVLRPDGVAYIVEPVASGAYFELVALVDDEREVRTLAQAAIAGAAGFAHVCTVEYDVPLHISSFSAFRER